MAFVENRDRLAGQDAAHELEQGHVRTPPGPVHGEEAKAGDRKTEEMSIRVRHQLVRLLGRRVERYGMVDVLLLGERLLRVRAVDRAGGGEDQMLRAVVA